jgi:hypothetical protein
MPEGVGTTIQRLMDLYQHDNEAQIAITGALQRPAGGNNNPTGRNQYEKKEVNFDNIQDDQTKAPTGTSRAAGLRTLRKNRPDLLDKVVVGEIAANCHTIEDGNLT